MHLDCQKCADGTEAKAIIEIRCAMLLKNKLEREGMHCASKSVIPDLVPQNDTEVVTGRTYLITITDDYVT